MNFSRILFRSLRRHLNALERRPHCRERRSANCHGVGRQVQRLESRSLLSVASVVSNNVLTISSDGADSIVVSLGSSGNIRVNNQTPTGSTTSANDLTSIQVFGGSGSNVINLAGVTPTNFPKMKQVSVIGGGGDDTLWAPDVKDVWAITTQNGGTINGLLEFREIENLVGGTFGNTFDFSNSNEAASLPISNVSGTITGRGGDLSITSSASESEVRLFNHVSNPGNIDIKADSILVNSNVTVSSRRFFTVNVPLVGTQIFTSGNSGNISLTAPSITLDHGAKLDASVIGGAYKSGNITLTATADTTIGGTFFYKQVDAKSTINLNGATLFGNNVSIIAISNSEKLFGDDSNVEDVAIDALSGFSAVAGVAISTAEGEINVNSGTVINAAGDLSLSSTAKTRAGISAISKALAVAYGKSEPTAKVTVNEGANLRSGGNLSISTNTNSTIRISASSSFVPTREHNVAADLTLAVSSTTSQSIATVAKGAIVIVGGDFSVQATLDRNEFTASAAAAYQDGSVGTAVTIATSTNTVKALVDGNVSANKNISITSKANALIDSSIATADVGNGKSAKAAFFIYEAPEGLKNRVDAFRGQLPAETDPRSGSTRKLALSAAFAYYEQTSNSESHIGPSAVVASQQGSVSVNALTSSSPEVIALAGVDSDPANIKKNALGAAVVYSVCEDNSLAFIGENATVTAATKVVVHSDVFVPQNVPWNEFLASSTGEVLDQIKNNYTSVIKFLTGAFNSLAATILNGDQTSLSGSVDIFTLTGSSQAYIGENAKVTQNAVLLKPRTTDWRGIDVQATNDVETINIAGAYDSQLHTGDPEAPILSGSHGGAVGGSYLQVTNTNLTSAVIKSGAAISSESLKVTATSLNRNFSLAVAGAQAETFSIDGSFSLLQGDEKTLAQIADGANVTVARVPSVIDFPGSSMISVTANESGPLLNFAGGIAKSQSVGVGFSVAVDDLTRETVAVIGTYGDDLPVSSGQVNATGEIQVKATNSGTIYTGSIAGAIASSAPAAPPANQPVEWIDEHNPYSSASVIGSPDNPIAGPRGAGQFGMALSGTASVNSISDKTRALVQNATIAKANGLTLSAKNDSLIVAIDVGFAVAIGDPNQSGLEGSYQRNTIDSSDIAAVIWQSQVTSPGSIKLIATDSEQIVSGSASGAVAGNRGANLAGSVAFNSVTRGTVRTAIENNSAIAGATALNLSSNDTSTIYAIAGAIGFGGGVSVGASVSLNQIQNAVSSTIDQSQVDTSGPQGNSTGSVRLDANTAPGILAVSAVMNATPTGGKLATAVSVSINNVANSATAWMESVTFPKPLGDTTLNATDTAAIRSITGDAAAGGKAGFGAAFSSNQVTDSVVSFVRDTALALAGGLQLLAKDVAFISSVATAGAGANTAGVAGAVTVNDIANVLNVLIDGQSVSASKGVILQADDGAAIESLAGAVAGGGVVSVGAGIASNHITETLDVQITNVPQITAQVVDLISQVDASIRSLAAGVAIAGDGAVAGGVSDNQIANQVHSGISNSNVTATSTLQLISNEISKISSIAGQAAISGQISVGGAAAYNHISNDVEAIISNSRLVSQSIFQLVSKSSAIIQTIAAGGAAGGVAGIAGSVAINRLENTIEALIRDRSVVTGAGSGFMLATNNDAITIDGGTFGVGGAAGFGGAAVVNTLRNRIHAQVLGGSSLTVSARNVINVNNAGDESDGKIQIRGLAILALDEESITTRGNAAAGAVTAGIAATVSVNLLENETTASVGENSVVQALVGPQDPKQGQVVIIQARNLTSLDVHVNSLGLAGVAGAGLSSETAIFRNKTSALVTNSKVLAENSVSVSSFSQNTVNATAVSAAGSFVGGSGAGNSVVIDLADQTTTEVSSALVRGFGQDVHITAKSNDIVTPFAGGATFGGVGGLGVSVVVTHLGGGTFAFAVDSKLDAPRLTEVVADSAEILNSFAVTTSANGSAGAAGTVLVTTLDRHTWANVVSLGSAKINTLLTSTVQDVNVAARDQVTIHSQAGAASISSLAAFGAVISVTTVRNAVTADLGGIVNAGRDINVFAESAISSDTDAIAGGGAFGSVQGSVNILNFGGVFNDQQTQAATTTSSQVNSVISANPVANNLGDSTNGKAAASAVGDSTSSLSAVSTFDPNASFTSGSLAVVSPNSILRTGRNLNVQAFQSSNVQALAGSLVGGAIGAGGAVALANVHHHSEAKIGDSVTLAAVGSITISSNSTVTNDGADHFAAKAGAAGGVGLGAAVAIFNSTNDSSATLGDRTLIEKTSNLRIASTAVTKLDVSAGAIVVGGAVGGIVISTVTEDGTTTAGVSGTGGKMGVDPLKGTIKNIDILATSVPVIHAASSGAVGGIVSGEGTNATAIATPTIRALIGENNNLQSSGNVRVSSSISGESKANTYGIRISLFGVGVSNSKSDWSPDVSTTIGNETTIISGASSYFLTSNAPAVDYVSAASAESPFSAHLVGVDGSKATATVGGQTQVKIGDGTAINSGWDIKVSASAKNPVRSSSSGISAGLYNLGLVHTYTIAKPTTKTAVETGQNVKLTSGANLSLLSDFILNGWAQSEYGEYGLFEGATSDANVDLKDNSTSTFVGLNNDFNAVKSVVIQATGSRNGYSNVNLKQGDFEGDGRGSAITDVRGIIVTHIGANSRVRSGDVNISAIAPTTNSEAHATTNAGRFLGAVRATASTTAVPSVSMLIDDHVYLEGTNTVTLQSRAMETMTKSYATASETAAVGTATANCDNFLSAAANMTVASGTEIVTPSFITSVIARVAGDDSNPGYLAVPIADGAWIGDDQENFRMSYLHLTPTLDFNAHVVILPKIAQGSTTDPQLIVAPDGTIRSNDVGLSGTRVGDTVTISYSDIPVFGTVNMIVQQQAPPKMSTQYAGRPRDLLTNGALTMDATFDFERNFRRITIINDSNYTLAIPNFSVSTVPTDFKSQQPNFNFGVGQVTHKSFILQPVTSPSEVQIHSRSNGGVLVGTLNALGGTVDMMVANQGAIDSSAPLQFWNIVANELRLQAYRIGTPSNHLKVAVGNMSVVVDASQVAYVDVTSNA